MQKRDVVGVFLHRCPGMGGYLAAAAAGLSVFRSTHDTLCQKPHCCSRGYQSDAEICKTSTRCHADTARPRAVCAVPLPSLRFSDKTALSRRSEESHFGRDVWCGPYMYQSLYTVILLWFSLAFEMAELYIIRMLLAVHHLNSLHSSVGAGDHIAWLHFQINAYLCKSYALHMLMKNGARKNIICFKEKSLQRSPLKYPFAWLRAEARDQ